MEKRILEAKMRCSFGRSPLRFLRLGGILLACALIVFFSIRDFGDSGNKYFGRVINSYGGRKKQAISNLERDHFPDGINTPLDKRIAEQFKKVEMDPHRFWLARTGLTETFFQIRPKHFIKDLDSPEAWENIAPLYYDPRITLTIYFNEIRRHYASLSTTATERANSNQLEPLTLPFNWVDWMDLTPLNDDLSKAMPDRISCEYIRAHTNNNPEPSYFCINNDQFSDEFVQSLGYKNRDQLPGFIIHAHSSHDDRPLNDIRVLEARSYAMTHMPKPLKVVILNGGEGGGTYEFNVDENSNQRIAGSQMFDNYLLSKGVDPGSITDETTMTLDHTIEFDDLLNAVVPSYLSDEDDANGMYRSLRKQGDRASSKQLEISAELFDYPKSMIEDQIRSYENRSEVPLESLSTQEKMYYEGLKTCQLYDDSNEPTYFKMAVIRIDDERNVDQEWGWHYDWRFFNGALNYERPGWTEQELTQRTNIILERLLRNWYRFAEEKGIITWIMHGPLLSWYWDGLMFPFDVDIDIQMPQRELARLAKNFNQTLVVEDPNEGYGKFLIDVGTFIHNRGISRNNNHIDARFVDVDSGIYIDITSLSKSEASAPLDYTENPLVNIDKPFKDTTVEIYNDRRKHFYKHEQLSPLKYSMMCGVPVYIPLIITDRLTFEYPNGVSSYEFHGWYFVPRLKLWLKKEQVSKVFDEEDIKQANGDINHIDLIQQVSSMSDDQVIALLEDDEVLTEYYLTKQITDQHDKEFKLLFDNIGRDREILPDNLEYNEMVSKFTMHKPFRKALWDYENLERPQHHVDEPQ